jgi:hypothetical protein
MHFYVQMPDADSEDNWKAVSAFSAEAAAEEYAEYRDRQSGGELFREDGDCRTIHVKEKGSDEITTYVVGFSYDKAFSAELEESV